MMHDSNHQGSMQRMWKPRCKTKYYSEKLSFPKFIKIFTFHERIKKNSHFILNPCGVKRIIGNSLAQDNIFIIVPGQIFF